MPVLGTLQALPDAGQAPAGPRFPAARAPAPGPPLHAGADPLPSGALDPQVHGGRHHLPGHGKGGGGFPCLLGAFVLGRVHGEVHPWLLPDGSTPSGSQRQAQNKTGVLSPGQSGQGKGEEGGRGRRSVWWVDLAVTTQHSHLYPAQGRQLSEDAKATQRPHSGAERGSWASATRRPWVTPLPRNGPRLLLGGPVACELTNTQGERWVGPRAYRTGVTAKVRTWR